MGRRSQRPRAWVVLLLGGLLWASLSSATPLHAAPPTSLPTSLPAAPRPASPPTSRPASEVPTSAAVVAPSTPTPRYGSVVRGQRVRRRAPADDPSSFSTRVEVDPHSPAELPALLAEVPGLKLRDQGGGQRQALLLRGAESHRVAVFLDGVRLNAPGGGGVDLALFDAAQLEAVEVRRSASSMRYGAAALGGAVILETPRLRRRRRTRLSLGYGSFGSLVGRAAHGGSWGRLRYWASGSYRQSDGDFDFVDSWNREAVRINNDSRRGELLLKADMDVGDWRLALLESLLLAERGMPGPLAGRDDTRQGDRRQVLALTARRVDPWVEGALLRLGLSHRLQRLRFDAAAAAQRSRNTIHSVEARANLLLPMAGWGRLDLGAELRGELFVDDLGASGEEPVGDHQRLLGDVFVSAQFQLWPERLRVVAGLRLASASDYGAQLLPKLGLLLDLWKSDAGYLEVVANAGRSVRYPAFSELYARFEGIRGDPSLEPEDALAADGGLRFGLSWLRLEGAYFRRLLVNAIRFAAIDSQTMMAAQNFGFVHVQGVETALTLLPWRCVNLRGAYTYTGTRQGEGDHRLPGQPAQRVATRVAWDGPSCGRRGRGVPTWLRSARLYIALDWQGEMVLGRYDRPPEEQRVLLSVGASYRWRWLTLALDGQNLLDKRDAVDVLGYPLPPARFFAQLNASF